ncbi:MCE family protein [Nocardia cyriacigeorgica]|uniref:MCE family protein n=2 Tax=Nocardia cyriacigeorgica TaxID=135487 RepID=UPI002458E9A0|nr:MCE family protein [Nocardia cyriacigeorgica]
MNRTATKFATSLTALCVLPALASGCRFDGVNSIPLPGTAVDGDTFTVTVELSDVQNLVGNSPVKSENVIVGNISRITSRDWTAVLTLEIRSDVQLPANASAKLSQNSVLGSQYLELTAPPDEQPQGRLGDGDIITLERTSQYPSTEEVLSALALVLNGSGLQQIQTVTSELNRVFDGNEPRLRSVIGNLRDFVAQLDSQRADIVAAIDGLDRLGSELAAQNDVIDQGLVELGPAVEVVDKQRNQLITMLTRLGEFGDAATHVLQAGRDDIRANVAALQPVLEQLATVGDTIPEALKIAATMPFPVMTADKGLRGDYLNLFLTLDVSAETVGGKVLGSIPIDELIGRNPSRQATDPLLAPSLPQPAGPRIPTIEEILADLQGAPR